MKKTPEMAVYSGGTRQMETYLGGRVVITVSRMGSRVVFRIENLPVYGRSAGTSILVSVPQGKVMVDGSQFRLRSPITSSEIFYRLEDGTEFPHLHVYHDGTPCMNGGSIGTVPQLFIIMTETVTWNNVTNDSYEHGHFIGNHTFDKLKATGDVFKAINKFKREIAKATKDRDEKPSAYLGQKVLALAFEELEAYVW